MLQEFSGCEGETGEMVTISMTLMELLLMVETSLTPLLYPSLLSTLPHSFFPCGYEVQLLPSFPFCSLTR